jgi:hypothetical protein
MLRVDPAVGKWGQGFRSLSARLRHKKQGRQFPRTGVQEGGNVLGNLEKVGTARSQEIRRAAACSFPGYKPGVKKMEN